MAKTVYKYPTKTPVSGNYMDGPEAPTGRIDYLKLQRFRINYASKASGGYGGENLPGNKVERDLNDTTIYLAMPPSLNTAYSANYSTVAMGAAGVLGTQLVGQLGGATQGRGMDAERVGQQLKAAAAAAMPEFAYKQGANMLNAVTGAAGLTNGAGDPNTLQALSSGRIMNPFTEQVFTGVGFRQHSFSFKMFARNKSEAVEIMNIIRYLKIGVMPKYGDADMKEVESLLAAAKGALSGENGENNSDTSTTTGDSNASSGVVDLSSFTSQGAYLEVPDRFLLEFVRLDPASSTISKIPHYKFQPCICTNMSVNYTPDGQYVSFKDFLANPYNLSSDGSMDQLMVPAVEISLDFAETKILTQVDVAQGF